MPTHATSPDSEAGLDMLHTAGHYAVGFNQRHKNCHTCEMKVNQVSELFDTAEEKIISI